MDYKDVFNWFIELVKVYKIKPLKVGYDRYCAGYLVQEMKEAGFHMDDVYQGTNLTPVLHTFEGDLKDGAYCLGENNLLRAHLLNVAVDINIAPIISAVKNAIDFVSNIISAFMALFRGDLDGFSQYIEAALKNLIEIVKNLITAVVNYIITFFQTFGVDVKKIFSDIWSGIVSIFSGVGAWFADKFRAAYTAITTIFSGIGQWFAARWTDIKNALSTVATWFQTMFQNAYTNVKNVFSVIGQWFNDRYTDIKSVFSTVGSWFYTKFTEAYTNIKNVFSNIGSFFSGIWNTIKGIFTNVGTNIGEAIGGAFKSAMNNALATVERAVNKAIGFINGAIDIINDIPGVSIGHVGEVSLPRLAKGGVLKNGQAIMAEAGPELIQMVNGEAVVTPLTASARNTALETAEGGGKSFVQNVNITSPKALSPYETARQTRNATRNMVLQLQGG